MRVTLRDLSRLASPPRRGRPKSSSRLGGSAPPTPRPERETPEESGRSPSATTTEARPLLDVFVPGRVRNPLNGSHGHWRTRAAWAKGWRHNTWLRITQAPLGATPRWVATEPKRVTITLHVWRWFDSDAMGPCAKPCRDALVDAGVVDSDGPKAPHEWIYGQRVDRQRPGVRIVVETL